MKFWILMRNRRFNPMNNFFKVMGLALAVHFIVKTVHKELK
jgi:hypothetical protein